jgi:glycosyltransferase involved in cell wall biosynthesis
VTSTSCCLSVIIPAYNEESCIRAIVERVSAIAPDLAAVGVEGPEVIVVDDGSLDRTAEIVAGMEGGVRLVRHAHNQGYGAALKTGFRHASGSLLGFLDADGTYPPEYFPNLCQAVLEGAELAIGSRMSGAESRMPLVRRVGNALFAALVTLVGGQRVRDSATGMRVLRREALSRLYPLPNGLHFTPAMSTRAIHEHLCIVEVPVPYHERAGRSKLSVVRDGTRFLRAIVWTALLYNPVRIFGGLGLLAIGLALALSGWFVALRIAGVTTFNPWRVAALYGALVFGVCGVSLFTLGSTFNYLISLFYERPIRQGLFGRPILSPWLDRQFGWLGLLAVVAGTAVGVASLVLGVGGWEIARLWLYLLGSALFILMGVQLIVSWVVMRVLEEISRRDRQIDQDLRGV